MNYAEFQLQALGDPRLAAYAASPLPAWLWSADGTRILWANPAGAAVFGAADGAALAKGFSDRPIGIAGRSRGSRAGCSASGAIRLERLQGFGAAPGMLATCGCSRLDFPDGSHGILIAAGTIALIVPRTALSQRRQQRGRSHIVRAAFDCRRGAIAAPAHRRSTLLTQPPSQPVEAPAEFALFDAFAEPPTAPVVQPDRCGRSARARSGKRAATRSAACRSHAARAGARRNTPEASIRRCEADRRRTSPTARVICRRAAAGSARLPLRFTWQMDQDGRFTLDIRRIHPPDRPAHRRWLRPAVARDRRDLRPRSRWPRDEGACHPRDLERHRR